jgi:simple sugar transport system ATP-binding protein
MAERVAHLGKKYGLEINPSARVSQLSLGEKQRVEIVKLLHRNSQILIFDEPTAVLTPREADQLFSAIRQMAKDGKAIVFISHKLDEVMEISDSISILRKGRVIDEMPIFEVTSKADLARRMVGREILLDVKKNEMEIRQRVLRVKGLSSHDLKEITFDLRQGEILGIVGVAGNGQKALVEIICGLTPPPSGSVTILGQSWDKFFSGRDDGGALSYIPEDRRGLGACLGLDMVDNFLLTTRKSFSNGPWLTKNRARKKLEDLVEAFKIYPRETSTMAGQLSGGNLQKLVLAREFFREPRLIVAEQPSQGLDIGATEELWKLLLTARERAGILLVTGDLSEALAMSDRIGVMFSGKMTDVFSVDDADKVDNIAMMMTGVGGPGIG